MDKPTRYRIVLFVDSYSDPYHDLTSPLCIKKGSFFVSLIAITHSVLACWNVSELGLVSKESSSRWLKN
ncbi:hypothetical protein RJT34_18908 [Clitoria ternatea]|uniref:Uncharacterized protein n=1 Tax=Clitoria ternatea TaxID=43366 RepID=A0AAN9IQ16_CLITE